MLKYLPNYFFFQAVLKVENGILLNNPLLVDTFLMIGAFLLCRLLLVELERRKFINPLVIYVARFIRYSLVLSLGLFVSMIFFLHDSVIIILACHLHTESIKKAIFIFGRIVDH